MSEPIVPPPPPVAEKKGLSTGAKVAIGCVVALLVVMGGCAIAAYMGMSWLGKEAKSFADDMEKNPNAAAVKAVEMMVKFNPDVDVVSSDPAKGTITLRDKKTGKVVTFNAEDIRNGKFSFEEDGKKTTLDFDQQGEQGGTLTVDSPEGRATYGSGDGAGVPSWVPAYPGARQEGFNSVESAGERSGTFTMRTADSVEKVVAWFEATLEDAGFEVEKSELDIAGAVTANLNAKSDGRGVNIVVSSQEGETQGLVAYSEKP
jgi:hypothetical protein